MVNDETKKSNSDGDRTRFPQLPVLQLIKPKQGTKPTKDQALPSFNKSNRKSKKEAQSRVTAQVTGTLRHSEISLSG